MGDNKWLVRFWRRDFRLGWLTAEAEHAALNASARETLGNDDRNGPRGVPSFRDVDLDVVKFRHLDVPKFRNVSAHLSRKRCVQISKHAYRILKRRLEISQRAYWFSERRLQISERAYWFPNRGTEISRRACSFGFDVLKFPNLVRCWWSVGCV